MQPRRLFAFSVLALASVALAACGSGNNDQSDITSVIKHAATSGDPAACTKDQTLHFTEQTFGGGRGQSAVQSCEKDAASSKSSSADVSNVKVSGNTATADVALTGAALDGQTVNVGLVKEGGQWKLDSFKGFTKFDRAKLIASFLPQLLKDPNIVKRAACVKQQLNGATDQQLEAVFLDPKAGEQILLACFH